MADDWQTIVEDEALADPLILPANGPVGEDRPEEDKKRAEEACAREDDLIAKDAERDLAAQRARVGPARRSRRLRSSGGRRTTGG